MERDNVWMNCTVMFHGINEVEIEFLKSPDRHVAIDFKNKKGEEGRIVLFLDEDSVYKIPDKRHRGFKRFVNKFTVTKDGPKVKEEI